MIDEQFTDPGHKTGCDFVRERNEQLIQQIRRLYDDTARQQVIRRKRYHDRSLIHGMGDNFRVDNMPAGNSGIDRF